MMATGAPRRLMAPPACVARRLLSLAPRIEPGMEFVYISGVALTTERGTMEGSFQAVAEATSEPFDVMVSRTELRGPAAGAH